MSQSGMLGTRVGPEPVIVTVERVFTFKVKHIDYEFLGDGCLSVRVGEKEAKRLAIAYHRALELTKCP